MVTKWPSTRLTIAATFAMGGRKLPLLIIFKGTPVESIERSLPFILPDDIIRFVQWNVWMGNRVMKIWYNSVPNP